jgi:fructose-1,6-bisphosphatase/inositol monophosphatase family enzyme
MFRMPSLEDVAEIMRETADAVIMPRYKALADGEVSEKTGPKDLVTIADIESEHRMTPLLKALLPGSVVIGEEAASENPAIFDLLKGDAPVWIIDPVDGTSNFAKGDRYFCVMVGLVRGGETLMGVILDPLGARWVGAEKGAGAWSHDFAGGEAIRLSTLPGSAPIEMRGAINFRFLESPLKEDMRARANDGVAHHYRLGCAGHEYLRMAKGEAHFAMYIKKMPWDHVPGCLIHAEAGGHQACFDGTPYRPHELDRGILAAPDPESWRALHTVLFGGTV